MAKTNAHQSTVEKSVSFQVPEAVPMIPEALHEVAASVPLLPDNAPLTAGSVPVPTERPTFPTPAGDYDPEAMQRARANQSDAVITLRRPAHARTTALGAELLGDCAIANELGTRQPVKALISKSDDKKWFFIMPSHHKSNKAVKITYNKGLANINLFGPFDEMGRLVEKGFRESFALAITQEPVTIHGVKGFALYFSLTHSLKESIKERPSTPGTTRTPKQPSRKQSATPEATATADSSPAAQEQQGPATHKTEGEAQSVLERINDEMLAERDDKIHDLEQKLKEYEKKLGKP